MAHEINFDNQGRILIQSPELARLLLRHVALHNGLEILVKVEPIGGSTPPGTLDKCPNICPVSANIRVEPRIATLRTTFEAMSVPILVNP